MQCNGLRGSCCDQQALHAATCANLSELLSLEKLLVWSSATPIADQSLALIRRKLCRKPFGASLYSTGMPVSSAPRLIGRTWSRSAWCVLTSYGADDSFTNVLSTRLEPVTDHARHFLPLHVARAVTPSASY